jgi:hypothetical protein
MIADTRSLSTDSYVLSNAVENKYGSSKMMITASAANGDDDPRLLLKLENCFSFGTDNKFNKNSYTIALSLKDQDDMVSALTRLEADCATRAGKDSEQIMRCLYRKGRYPTLYVKINDDTQLYDVSNKLVTDYKTYKDKRFSLDVILHIDSVFIPEKTTSIQVKLYEARLLANPPKEKIERKRLL